MATRQIPVSSSLLIGAEYDGDAQELRLTFKTGARWAYGNFSESDAEEFEGAGSKGQWFLQNIKGSFPERRI